MQVQEILCGDPSDQDAKSLYLVDVVPGIDWL